MERLHINASKGVDVEDKLKALVARLPINVAKGDDEEDAFMER